MNDVSFDCAVTFGGAVAQQPAAFDSLAGDNSLSFGNLAQQQQQQPSGFGAPPSFGSTNNNPTFGSGSNFGYVHKSYVSDVFGF